MAGNKAGLQLEMRLGCNWEQAAVLYNVSILWVTY